jgi:hypothetical protein
VTEFLVDLDVVRREHDPAAPSIPADTLGLIGAQRAIVAGAVPLEPLPVDPRIAFEVHEAGGTSPESMPGAITLSTAHGPKLKRTTAYRFQRRDILNEHLFHAWPGEGYDFPALTTVVFELPNALILGADLIPIADVAFDREYYGRWYAEHTDLVAEHWPRLSPHLLAPSPAPDAYFTNQLGSRLAVLTNLRPEGFGAAVDYVLALTELWTRLWERAEPSPAAYRDQTEARRHQLMTRAYKGLDYHSPASPSLASVLGWTGANLVFDHVFGPDVPEQALDQRRTYLDVEVSPGTAARVSARDAG